eukprot:3406836-Rhodomonas_salina.2
MAAMRPCFWLRCVHFCWRADVDGGRESESALQVCTALPGQYLPVEACTVKREAEKRKKKKLQP